MLGDLWDHLDIGPGLGQDDLVHPFHVGRYKRDERLDPGCALLLALVERNYQSHGQRSRFVSVSRATIGGRGDPNK
ncbi:hypothetical protein K32_12410 [Kaistia sp. 32K]|nr:hypothetical protein K32_12410 [Kaistia sp. 32K]